jgi:hypothetical protein
MTGYLSTAGVEVPGVYQTFKGQYRLFAIKTAATNTAVFNKGLKKAYTRTVGRGSSLATRLLRFRKAVLKSAVLESVSLDFPISLADPYLSRD